MAGTDLVDERGQQVAVRRLALEEAVGLVGEGQVLLPGSGYAAGQGGCRVRQPGAHTAVGQLSLHGDLTPLGDMVLLGRLLVHEGSLSRRELHYCDQVALWTVRGDRGDDRSARHPGMVLDRDADLGTTTAKTKNSMDK